MTVSESRLVITNRPTHRDHLHGAWWPRTTDVDRELPLMLATAVARFGVVLGVMLNRDEWPGATLAGQAARWSKVKVSWYGLPEAHLVVLHCSGARRIALLLLSPDLPERIAVTATLMASTPGNALSTEEVLATAHDRAQLMRSD